jgi:hypothetical protein
MSDLLTLFMARNVTSVDDMNLVRFIIREVPIIKNFLPFFNLIYLTCWKEEVLMYIFRLKLWKYTKQRWGDEIKNGVEMAHDLNQRRCRMKTFLVDILKWLQGG